MDERPPFNWKELIAKKVNPSSLSFCHSDLCCDQLIIFGRLQNDYVVSELCLTKVFMQAKEIERLNGVYKKLLNSNGVDMFGEPLSRHLVTILISDVQDCTTYWGWRFSAQAYLKSGASLRINAGVAEIAMLKALLPLQRAEAACLTSTQLRSNWVLAEPRRSQERQSFLQMVANPQRSTFPEAWGSHPHAIVLSKISGVSQQILHICKRALTSKLGKLRSGLRGINVRF